MAIIFLIMYIPIDVILKSYLNQDMKCVLHSMYFLSCISLANLLILFYFSYRILFVEDPFFLRFEILVDLIYLLPFIIFISAFTFNPNPFLSFLDLRLSSLTSQIGGFLINMLFPTLLTFSKFEKGVLKLIQKKEKKDQSQSESEMKSKKVFFDQSKDEFFTALQNPILFDSFVEYTVKDWSVENILFYQAVEIFEEGFQKSDFNPMEGAQKVIDEFIVQRSPLEVNIESSRRNEILSAIKVGNVQKNIFSDAQNDIYRLMKVDSFEKWKTTPGYSFALEKAIDIKQSNEERMAEKKESLNSFGEETETTQQQKLPKTPHIISQGISASQQNLYF